MVNYPIANYYIMLLFVYNDHKYVYLGIVLVYSVFLHLYVCCCGCCDNVMLFYCVIMLCYVKVYYVMLCESLQC